MKLIFADNFNLFDSLQESYKMMISNKPIDADDLEDLINKKYNDIDIIECYIKNNECLQNLKEYFEDFEVSKEIMKDLFKAIETNKKELGISNIIPTTSCDEIDDIIINIDLSDISNDRGERYLDFDLVRLYM
jgi:hypothetical protein